MARHFTVTLTSGTNIGPYTIYHTSSTNGNQALLYGTSNQATNLTLAQVQGGVLITVPDNATSVIFYNTNDQLIKNCPTNIVEYPLTPSGTPQPTPNATPQPTPNPSATPLPTNGATPQPTPNPSATPNVTQMPTYTPTPIPSATPSPSPSATPNCDFDIDIDIATPTPTPSPSQDYSTFFRSTVKSQLGSEVIVDENGDPGGFCDNSYLVNTRFYVEGDNRNLHSSLQDQNVYTDANLTNPLPDGYYYCSPNSEETGGTTYTATTGVTHKYIQVQFGIGRATTGVHNCTNGNPGGNDN